jgi:shikimate kinase
MSSSNPVKKAFPVPTREQFLNQLQEGVLNIIFVGPSGVGKTSWKTALKTIGFGGVEMDEQIGKNPKVSYLLEEYEGEDEAEKMGNFFGKPWEDPDAFAKQEEEYLQVEKEEMTKLLSGVNHSHIQVMDMTGSAIYCAEELAELSKHGLVVYLKAGQEQYDKMQEIFLSDPKPIIWGKELLAKWKEAIAQGDPLDALPRLFGELLDYRHRLYEKSADVIIDWEIHREKVSIDNPQALLEEIGKQLG